jgi:hypothetical protein
MPLRHLGDKTAEEFARILERHSNCEIKRARRRPCFRVRRRTRGEFGGQALHLYTRFHSGLQRTVLHNLGFTDDEIDRLYPP